MHKCKIVKLGVCLGSVFDRIPRTCMLAAARQRMRASKEEMSA
jgi:hypothetical protein